MQTRTRLALVLAVAAIVAAAVVTCESQTEPSSGDRPPEVTEAPADRKRPARRRVVRPPAEQAPPALGSGGPVLARGAYGVTVSGTDEPSESVAAVPTGRVRVRMLKDGRAFEGGHVCFFPEASFVEPAVWDGVQSGDGTYFGVPLYTRVWPHFDPVLGTAAPVGGFRAERGITGPDGTVTVDIPAGRTLVTFVRYMASGIPLVSQPRVNVVEGEEVSITIEAARQRTITGRCLDDAGKPLASIAVQVISALEERPLSRIAHTTAAGGFELAMFGAEFEVRLRAVAVHPGRPLGIYDAESDVPPIPAETTVGGVEPGADSVEIRMHPAPLVYIELLVAEGEKPLGHLQIEGLAFDPRAGAWGRLGGPQYRRAVRGGGGRRAVIALPRADAVRPLMLWSWGWTITAVDPRGRDRVSVEIPRGRRAGVRGTGWHETDRLRVVSWLGPAGQELPCIWIDGAIGKVLEWSRDDSPVAAIEYQIVRDGVVVGRSARVPPGTGPAELVTIDVK